MDAVKAQVTMTSSQQSPSMVLAFCRSWSLGQDWLILLYCSLFDEYSLTKGSLCSHIFIIVNVLYVVNVVLLANVYAVTVPSKS